MLLARDLANRGFDLVICARSGDGLDTARRELAKAGGEVVAVRADVSVPSEADELITAATTHFGRLDMLVNNASVIQVGPAVTMRAE